MLKFLDKLFSEQLKLSADLWAIILIAVVAVAFLIALVLGLTTGEANKIKARMKAAIANPSTVVKQMQMMPADVKSLYKTARISNAKPSALVTKQVCVDEPNKHSLVSKIWLVTFIATVICAALAYLIMPIAYVDPKATELTPKTAMWTAPVFVLIVGGILTIVGGIIGRVSYGGASKLYNKFVPVMDGDKHAAEEQHAAAAEQQPAYAAEQPVYAAEQQPVYAEPQATVYEPQAEQAEPVGYEANDNNAYAEAQPVYEQAQQYAEPIVAEPQESDEEIRRKAREEAIAQARAQQEAQVRAQAAQAQAQAQAQTAQPAAGGASSADDVIAQIEKISREGAPRETMREVATLLQKERAKPENKTPEQQKRLNDALSKLLKAMSAASRR